jgi:hypothetical protein
MATMMKRLLTTAILLTALNGTAFAGRDHRTQSASHMPMVIARGDFLSQYLAKMRGLRACPPRVPPGYYMAAVTGTFDSATCYQPIFDRYPQFSGGGSYPPLWLHVH